MTPAEREDQAINRWCRVVQRFEGRRVRITSRPDRENAGHPGCDATVRRGDRDEAVEHTTVDPYANRRQDDHRFRIVMLATETAVEREIPDSWVEIQVPAHAVPAGVNWTILRDRVAARVVDATRGMPIADYHDLTRTRFDWDDVPFPVWICRGPLDEGRTRSRCIIFRQAPDVAEQLERNLRRSLGEKEPQLAPYAGRGSRTVLLLDFDDIVLLNADLVGTAFARAVNRAPVAIDEVYLVDSCRRPPWILPVKIDHTIYPHLQQFEQYFSQQYEERYGDN